MFLLGWLLEVFIVSTAVKCHASFGIFSVLYVSVRSFVSGSEAVLFRLGSSMGRGPFSDMFCFMVSALLLLYLTLVDIPAFS